MSTQVIDFLSHWISATYQMITLSAGSLLLGFFLAGLLHHLAPLSLIQKHLQKPGLGSVLKASAVGIPLPLCSCGVIPVGVSLRQRGASKGATASFLISTPEIGVDSFVLSYTLLGPMVAIWRTISAFVSAVLAGLTIDILESKSSSKEEVILPSSLPDDERTTPILRPTLFERAHNIFHYGFVEVVDDLVVMLMFGFIGAGFISALVPDMWFAHSGLSELNTMLLMLVISLPLYVCAASSTPLATALVAKGLSPGAALVFLLAGPASNITTMFAVIEQLGKQALLIYIVSISGVAMISGFALNAFLPVLPGAVTAPVHSHGSSPALHTIATAFLIGVLGLSFWRKLCENRSGFTSSKCC